MRSYVRVRLNQTAKKYQNLTGISHGDILRFTGIKPHFSFPALHYGCGETLLGILGDMLLEFVVTKKKQ